MSSVKQTASNNTWVFGARKYPDDWENTFLWHAKVFVHFGYPRHGWTLLALLDSVVIRTSQDHEAKECYFLGRASRGQLVGEFCKHGRAKTASRTAGTTAMAMRGTKRKMARAQPCAGSPIFNLETAVDRFASLARPQEIER
ncbi:hypothetical protein PY257_07975 [Ramlibacter sp. H39-3-26]|uniref:hypothetical protein n=1 Tax=Curvibacter soli TaxID=3031331 RepID=UPI0023DB961D|nr:hypothetical protein [Ramlibacter sp. H39-3-26]MDF1485118.1 hypothetical protein [Ramlibacter sp. H39-3-26]